MLRTIGRMTTLVLNTATVIAFLVSIVIPLVSSLLSKANWPPDVTGILTLLIAAANGFLTQWAQGGAHYNWQAGAVTALVSFIVAIAARYGLWKGTKIDAKVLAFPRRVKGVQAARLAA